MYELITIILPALFTLIKDSVTIMKDFATIFSVVTVGVIAILGYGSWKKQLKGKTKYELARRLLLNVYQARDAIRDLRNPVILSWEEKRALKEANIEIADTDPDYKLKTLKAIYEMRWRRVAKAGRELEVDQFEAEVIMGPDVQEGIETLKRIMGTIYFNLGLYFNEQESLPPKRLVRVLDVLQLSTQLTDELDKKPFTLEIDESIRQIENSIKPYLEL